ncbi:hypothetical protein ACJRO7_018422 [Eucalyptus globulus]|uniref:Protein DETOXIFICATION n=1 Tax=Eucalyptus globulus TaxID=34317 RepID=A0ABD3KZW2_EUCGL
MLAPLVPKDSTSPRWRDQEDPSAEDPGKTSLGLLLKEGRSLSAMAVPMVLTRLLIYARSAISMLFLGRLGDLALAGGSLAIGFANITGYSVLSGLAMGMEPICGQAFGAGRYKVLGLTMQRAILLLLLTSIPISVLWLNMKPILLYFGQQDDISSQAQLYILCSLPDLAVQSLLHPLRIYLCYAAHLLRCSGYHPPPHLINPSLINYLLVNVLGQGIKGIALAAVLTNINLVASLILYILISGVHEKTWGGFSSECLKGFKSLVDLAVPSCISVCLEWWWYEIMILLCGYLLNPRATVASMGVLIQTTALVYIFPSSLSFSVSTRVGNELGAGQPDKARLATKVGLAFSFVLGFAALVFTTMVRHTWARMFTQDADIVALTSMVLPIIGLCELGNCPQTTRCGVLRETARPKMGAHINLGCFYLVGMPIAVWLSFFLGFDFKGLWLGLLAAQGSCVVTLLLVLVRTDWEGEAWRAQELTRENATAVDGDHDRHDGATQYWRSHEDGEEDETSMLLP